MSISTHLDEDNHKLWKVPTNVLYIHIFLPKYVNCVSFPTFWILSPQKIYVFKNV